MKKINLLIISFALSVFSCKNEKKEILPVKPEPANTEIKKSVPKKIEITLNAKSKSNVSGSVVFSQNNDEVSMIAKITGLEPGEHAIHIHQTSDCSSENGKSAGGHWNPTNTPHGKWGAKEGYHKGDIGNFTADSNGNASVSFSTNEWCIGCGDQTKDIIGKGVIIHAGTDDLTSQPSGAAGARISCAGIIK